jgi:3-phosphoshikimate 1-carboxyvinyltransferase
MTIRAFAAALLASGSTPVLNYSKCTDALNALSIIKSLGADILLEEEYLIIKGAETLKQTDIYCGESGLNARLFGLIGLLANKRFHIFGQGSLVNRKINDLQLLYLTLGIMCGSNGGYLPFTLEGHLQGGEFVFDGSTGSQALSGLLYTLPVISNDSFIRLQNITSKPYIDMTLDMLSNFGIKFENNNYKSIYIKSGQKFIHSSIEIEADWSGAAFPLVAGAIHGKAELKGLNLDSLQGDKVIIDILTEAGAIIYYDDDTIIAEKGRLKAFNFDFRNYPDLFPPLLVMACFCEGESVFTGIERIKNKESNRIDVLTKELIKMGSEFRMENDKLIILGGKVLNGAEMLTHNDHRVAMALIVASLGARGDSVIRGVECIDKSWVDFLSDFGELFNNKYKIV